MRVSLVILCSALHAGAALSSTTVRLWTDRVEYSQADLIILPVSVTNTTAQSVSLRALRARRPLRVHLEALGAQSEPVPRSEPGRVALGPMNKSSLEPGEHARTFVILGNWFKVLEAGPYRATVSVDVAKPALLGEAQFSFSVLPIDDQEGLSALRELRDGNVPLLAPASVDLVESEWPKSDLLEYIRFHQARSYETWMVRAQKLREFAETFPASPFSPVARLERAGLLMRLDSNEAARVSLDGLKTDEFYGPEAARLLAGDGE